MLLLSRSWLLLVIAIIATTLSGDSCCSLRYSELPIQLLLLWLLLWELAIIRWLCKTLGNDWTGSSSLVQLRLSLRIDGCGCLHQFCGIWWLHRYTSAATSCNKGLKCHRWAHLVLILSLVMNQLTTGRMRRIDKVVILGEYRWITSLDQ